MLCDFPKVIEILLYLQVEENYLTMRKKLVRALGSIAVVLLLSGVISILEYRRMSDYVSELIASNIKSVGLSQKLADITQEYASSAMPAPWPGSCSSCLRYARW